MTETVRKRPSLLFISSVVPKLTGTGIAMRAGMHIRELASSFEVTLGIVLDGQEKADAKAELPTELSSLCAEILISSKRPLAGQIAMLFSNPLARNIATAVLRTPPASQRSGAARELARQLAAKRFDVVHCFRLITGQIPLFLKAQGCSIGRTVLDMDDYESRTKKRYADTILRGQGIPQFIAGRREALKWAVLEDYLVPRFDDVYVCSEMDQDLLRQRYSGPNFFVVPNVIEPPKSFQRSPAKPFTFLFVGTLGYPPNRDAALFFCDNILPLLRRATTVSFRIQIVGARADATVKRLGNGGDIEVVGAVPDVTPFYLSASAAIVPLRAGGGTRIKILEAFSYALPVVSTSIGAEGLEISNQTDILIANTPDAFAKECQKLLCDQALRQRIGLAGHALYQKRYTVARLTEALAIARPPV